MGLCVFGADNYGLVCHSLAPSLGLQVGWRREVPIELHIWPLRGLKSFITPTSKWTQTQPCQKTAESLFLVTLFEADFKKKKKKSCFSFKDR